jgi:hypothetical protein
LDAHGTIIIIPYSESLDFELTKQFTNSKTILNPTERIDCVFSKFKQVVFKYTSRDKIIDQLDMYDFFGGEKRDYYTGIDSNVIKIYKTNRGYDYVLDKNDTHLAIQRSGPGWGKEPTEYHHHMTKPCVGSFKINVAVRAHNDYFNPEKPKCPTVYSKLYGYDADFFTDDAIQREHLAKPYLVRNGHTIGKFNLETIKFNAGRGGGKSCLQALKTRADVEYSTPSNHENIYDEIFSIQENKNQLNDESVPKQIIRLIEYCIKQHSNNVWDYFTGEVERVEIEEVERVRKEEVGRVRKEEEERLRIEEEERLRKEKIKLDRYFDELSPTDTINDKLLKLCKFMKEHHQTVYTMEIYEKIVHKLATTINST